jgi:heme-degrading monooxygenase HmoA
MRATGQSVCLAFTLQEVTVYARMMRVQLKPGSANDALRIWHDDILPLVQRQPGFNGGTLLLDRDGSSAVSITRWESLADLAAGDTSGFLRAQVAKLADFIAGTPERVVYEVAYEDAPAARVNLR